MPVGALVLYSNYTFNGALVYWWYKLRASSGSAVHLYAYRVYHAYETCVVLVVACMCCAEAHCMDGATY